MLPFENMVADYVKETGNHVAYRVTPVFIGDELVARGVLMEAWSVEDNGAGVGYCVFVYNVQPGVTIDYAIGISHLNEDDDVGDNTGSDGSNNSKDVSSSDNASDDQRDYVLNTSTNLILDSSSKNFFSAKTSDIFLFLNVVYATTSL